MKRTKQYEAPQSEVIELETQGVLCLSKNPLTGGVMNMGNNGGGSWNQLYPPVNP